MGSFLQDLQHRIREKLPTLPVAHWVAGLGARPACVPIPAPGYLVFPLSNFPNSLKPQFPDLYQGGKNSSTCVMELYED